MIVKRLDIERLFKDVGLQENDPILYLGGRIDDDKLYPPKYRKYLKDKIKRLNPTKIICHNHWYAKKYYERGILSKNAKIDMIFVYYNYLVDGKLQAINPTDYQDHRTWMKILIDKNPNIVYAMYISEGHKPPAVDAREDWFTEDYDLNNIKYFSFDGKYSPPSFAHRRHGRGARDASDGFGCINQLLDSGLKNLNIIGFSAFGSDEDMSYHSEYDCNGDKRFLGRKLFDLNTSEDLRTESDIMKHWAQTKKITNLENHSKLLDALEEK